MPFLNPFLVPATHKKAITSREATCVSRAVFASARPLTCVENRATSLFWGGTNYSVHATNISETAVLLRLSQLILPSARAEQISAVTLQHHQHTYALLFKELPKHSPINPASTSEKQTWLCKPQITDWDAKGWSWRLEYSRGLKGAKGSIQLPQIPRYVCTQTQGDPRITFWNEQPPASAWYSGPNSCPLSTPSSCKKTPQTQVSAGQTQQGTEIKQPGEHTPVWTHTSKYRLHIFRILTKAKMWKLFPAWTIHLRWPK